MGRICCSCRPKRKTRWTAMGRSFDFITKWNPRKQDKDAWVARTDAAGVLSKLAQVSEWGC